MSNSVLHYKRELPEGAALPRVFLEKGRVWKEGLLRPRQSRCKGARSQTNGHSWFGERRSTVDVSGVCWGVLGSSRGDNCLKNIGYEGEEWESNILRGEMGKYFGFIFKCVFKTTETEFVQGWGSDGRSIYSVNRIISTHLQVIKCHIFLILVLCLAP